MGKNNGDGFNNEAARKFRDPNRTRVMSQADVFDVLDSDIKTILEQVTNNRNHKGKFPRYVADIFVNLSAAKFFLNYVQEHTHVKKSGKLETDLDDDEIESLRTILSDVYKKTASNYYQTQAQDFKDRSNMIAKAFVILNPKLYLLAEKLNKGIPEQSKLKDFQLRDLTVQVWGDPASNMKYIRTIFDNSVASPKKKMRIVKKMYGKDRWVSAVGAAMTVNSNNSDFIGMLITYVNDMKMRKRAPFVRAYADAYKKNETANFRINDDFLDDNRKLIKELRKIDVGYRKAFRRKAISGRSTKKAKPYMQ